MLSDERIKQILQEHLIIGRVDDDSLYFTPNAIICAVRTAIDEAIIKKNIWWENRIEAAYWIKKIHFH